MSVSAISDDTLLVTLNAGSSSLKAAAFTRSDLTAHWTAKVDRINGDHAQLSIRRPGNTQPVSQSLGRVDHRQAAEAIFAWMKANCSESLAGIAHRIVHGGPKHGTTQRATSELIQELRALSDFDPNHLPGELDLVETSLRSHPDVPQVLCFDTAFHWDLPREAQLLPIPRRLFERGVRRYGFHGLSYTFLVHELERLAGSDAAKGKLVLAHLGSGASLAAVHQKKSVDTTMAFSPASGVMMGTRSGDLDPGLVYFLQKQENLSAREFNDLIHHQSGLLGLSETSGDLRDLLACEASDTRAAEAVSVFCYQVRKAIAALAAALGGVDTLVFSGGIGENQPGTRERISASLGFLGVEFDPTANRANAPIISSPTSRVTVRVIPTNEEWVMARELQQTLSTASN